MERLTIGEVARRVGLQTSAIRYYERIGLLHAPDRVNGVRQYGEDIFGRLGIIQLARRLGFGISEVQALLHDFPTDTPPSQRWGTLAPKKIDELDTLINQALVMRKLLKQTLTCDCSSLEDCAAADVNLSETRCVIED